MTHTEHLERIKKRCESLLKIYGDCGPQTYELAGWKSTIAAIDAIERDAADETPEAKAIISAWPESLL